MDRVNPNMGLVNPNQGIFMHLFPYPVNLEGNQEGLIRIGLVDRNGTRTDIAIGNYSSEDHPI